MGENTSVGQLIGAISSKMASGTVISVLIVLLGWHVFGSTMPAHVFPNLTELAEALIVAFSGAGEYSPWEHMPMTFARIALTFLIAMPIGMLVGIGMGLNWRIEAFFSPYIVFSLAFPSIVWAFLGVIWFGLTTFLVPVFVGVLITAPYVAINTWEGTKDLDTDLLEMAETYDSNRLHVWRYILIPHLMPYTFAMMRIVLAVGWKIMIVAEIFGTQSGLGFVINEFFLRNQNDMIIAWTIPAMVGIFLLDRVLARVEAKQFEWRPSAETNTDRQMAGA